MDEFELVVKVSHTLGLAEAANRLRRAFPVFSGTIAEETVDNGGRQITFRDQRGLMGGRENPPAAVTLASSYVVSDKAVTFTASIAGEIQGSPLLQEVIRDDNHQLTRMMVAFLRRLLA